MRYKTNESIKESDGIVTKEDIKGFNEIVNNEELLSSSFTNVEIK